MGSYQREGHRLWKWRHDPTMDRLLCKGANNTVDVYELTDRPNRWVRTSAGTNGPLVGNLCLVNILQDGRAMITGSTESRPETNLLPSFLQSLLGENDQWIWNNLQITGDVNWLAAAVTAGSVLAVTDGSYMEDVYPDICSAAFIFECRQVGGEYMAPLSNDRRTPAPTEGN